MGCWVDLEMRRYIILLLITGIVWAQTDFDKLVLKDGTTYLGEYSKTEKEIVYFKPQDAFAFQPVSVPIIKSLKLKDGHHIIGISSQKGCFYVIIIIGLLAYLTFEFDMDMGFSLNYNNAHN